VWLFYPETKGLTLEQIDSLFSKQDDSNERAEGMNEVEAKTGFAAHVDRLSCFAPE
jgi:predicted lipoprotein